MTPRPFVLAGQPTVVIEGEEWDADAAAFLFGNEEDEEGVCES